MLLIELAYEGEQAFIEDIQGIVNLLKTKQITVGISESLESNTHFIKIFCDDKNYSETLKSVVYRYISNILYKVVIDNFRHKELLEYLTENYFFLHHDEMVILDGKINNILSDKESIKDETTIYCLNRMNKITDNIREFLEENGFVNITGFITFRMRMLTKYIQEIIDKVIEDYIVEKEYNEFIKLLKYFVEIQECKIDEINIIVEKNGEYQIKDKHGEDIFSEFIRDISDNQQGASVNLEDIIISGLITNSPQKINIYNENICINREFIQTIKKVFGERVTSSSECKFKNY